MYILYKVKQVIAFILSLYQILSPFVFEEMTSEGRYLMYEWSEDLEFGEEHYIELEKTPGEDFRILNLSDIQIYDEELYSDGIGRPSYDLVAKVIEDHEPDLITISGDSFCSTLSSLELIELIDSYGIKWAPVLGNHDGGNANEWVFWATWHLYRAEHSLFEYGPRDMGYGNYIINITEDGDVIHTLYMMDTHAGKYYTVKGKTVYGYDHLWDNQIAWYEWAVRGNETLAGHPIQSTVIVHIPPYEYKQAWISVADKKTKEKGAPYGYLDPKYSDIATGHSGAYGGFPHVTNGFFDKVKELGSTKDIIAGHDHNNDYSVLYQGVRLSYGLHTGFGDHYRDDMLGATLYTIDSNGETSIQHSYYSYVDGEWIPRDTTE